jgi:3-dehydroquinate dehydratase
MPDYGGPGGFGPGTTGGGEAATGGVGGSGYGGRSRGGQQGQMSQATRDALAAMAETDVSNTDAEVAKSRLAEERDRQMFSQKMQNQADVNNPVKYSDTLALYDALKAQNINPNEVSLKNFTTGPFAQKNVVMHKNRRIGQFGALPAFGLSGFLADIVGLDLRGLQLDQSTFGEPDRGGRADERSIMEILYPSEETFM